MFFHVNVVATGDVIRPNENIVIVMNHRTRLDWMYFWSVLLRQSGVFREKIILKSSLKSIPGAGLILNHVLHSLTHDVHVK